MIKVGVIGCGTIANAAHIPSYLNNDEAEIKYFCDILPEKAKAAVEKYGCGIAIEDYHDIIADPEVEAVSVCTPNKMHSIISVDCLRGGKHVLCEKPAARTYADALEMQKAQHETGKVLNIGVVNRFNDGVNRIKEYIDQGRLGNIHHVYVSFRAHRSIPGLERAELTRLAYAIEYDCIDSRELRPSFESLRVQGLYFAGQMTGVEGYVESASSGLLAGISLARRLRGEEAVDFPTSTAIGALSHYIAAPNHDFQPMNVTFGIIDPLGERIRNKAMRYERISQRALEIVRDLSAKIDN